MSNTYTAYIVRNANRRFLNQRTFTGRTPNMWGAIGDAHVFTNEETAHAAAGSINRRPKARSNAAYAGATVVPITMYRRGR